MSEGVELRDARYDDPYWSVYEAIVVCLVVLPFVVVGSIALKDFIRGVWEIAKVIRS